MPTEFCKRSPILGTPHGQQDNDISTNGFFCRRQEPFPLTEGYVKAGFTDGLEKSPPFQGVI